MRQNNVTAKIFAVFFVFFITASSSLAAERIIVTTTMMPLSYFIEEIGGEHVDVNVMIPSGGNPHSYEPTPGQMRALSRSGLYVKLGSGIEFELMWMDKLTALNPSMAVCDVSRGIQLIPMGGGPHECGNGHDHHHEEADPHIWLSLDNAVIITGNIRDALIEVMPGQEEFFRKRAVKMMMRIDELKRYALQTLEEAEGRTFLIFHPAWGYFARDFNLTQITVEHGGKEPRARQLNAVIRQANALEVKVVFASPQFSKKSAEVIAREIGGRVVMVDPLARDFMENMRRAIDAFAMGAR